MPRVTPFRICRPSTLARRSLISKSANFRSLLCLYHLVSAIAVGLGHPGRPRDRLPQQPLVHLLLVQTRKPRPRRNVLDGAVAVPDREPTTTGELDRLGHV